ncbi:hypothetical protein B296_00036739 [Ensete ventricosum]|uniref:Armadillo repeat-containing domain-containing protein n=1 Tax=Ensete ventricosum TaxID=4639 RepID=A0A426XIV6_ENSVE|nr:hypothetical protein B296_00036739 [Ensete ventricosum]
MAKCMLPDAAALRRRILEAVACGASRHRGRRKACGGVDVAEPFPRRPRPGRAERLMEILQAEPSDSVSDEADDAEARRKVEAFEEIQRVVRRLQLDDHNAGGDPQEEAATEVRRLAKDDPEARETLAMLGVIPPLVGMLDSKDPDLHVAALYALLNLGIGNEFPETSPTARQDALRALFNLSIASVNLPLLVDAGLVPSLLAAMGDMAVTERSLAVISNLVASGEGRRAVSLSADAFAILIDVLGWCDAAACQEKATYVLMVMAHKGHGDRAAMVEAGAVSALLELTLLGTPLAQKRASRLLEILTVEKGKRESEAGGSSGVSVVSAPLRVVAAKTAPAEEGMSEERRAVRELVQQSLQNNMRRVVRRANLAGDLVPQERLRALTATSTLKSLLDRIQI